MASPLNSVFETSENKTFWDNAFCYGSGIATFAQGLVLGTFIQGFRVSGRQFAGTSFDFLSPFALLTGVALLFGYGLLGAGWLVLKTEGSVQDSARQQGRICLVVVILAIVIVSVWTPFMSESIATRWFGWPNVLFLHRCRWPLRLSLGSLGERLAAMRKSFPSSGRSACSCSLISASRSVSIL